MSICVAVVDVVVEGVVVVNVVTVVAAVIINTEIMFRRPGVTTL